MITRISELPDFDPAEHLEDGTDIAACLTLVIEEGDFSELAHALGIVARPALYKTPRPDAQPRFDAIALCLLPVPQTVAEINGNCRKTKNLVERANV